MTMTKELGKRHFSDFKNLLVSHLPLCPVHFKALKEPVSTNRGKQILRQNLLCLQSQASKFNYGTKLKTQATDRIVA